MFIKLQPVKIFVKLVFHESFSPSLKFLKIFFFNSYDMGAIQILYGAQTYGVHMYNVHNF